MGRALKNTETLLTKSAVVNAWAFALLALCLLMYLAPYFGIRHDSMLYLGQVLFRWKPEELGGDLFFAFGSQAQYTVFPQLLAGLLEHFPAGPLFKVLSLAGRVAFAAATYLLLRELFPAPFRYWGLLSVLAMPTGYGGFNMLSYGETFVTARSMAEPLVLLTLAALVRGAWIFVPGLLLIAGLLHPLQAVTGALLIWMALASRDVRWLHLVWLLVAAVLLLSIGESIRLSLFTRFDSLWLESILESTKQLLLLEWPAEDWLYLITDMFLVALVWRSSEGWVKRMAIALLASVIVAFTASLILVDGFHLVLPAGLQMWRIHWLLHWFAMASIPWSLWKTYAEAKAPSFPLLILLVAIIVLGSPASRSSIYFVLPLLMALFVGWPAFAPKVGSVYRQAVVWGVAGALAISLCSFVLAVLQKFSYHDFDWDVFRPQVMLLTHPLVSGAIVIASVTAWRNASQSWRVVLSIALSCGVLGALLQWDQRNAATLEIEAAERFSSPFGVDLVPGSQVLWTEDNKIEQLLAIWLMLGRSSYFSKPQTGGVVFSRDTALEVMARRKILATFKLQETICTTMNALNGTADSCVPDEDALREVCHLSGGQLSYVVISNRLETPSLGLWTIPDPRRPTKPINYYLYSCKDLLRAQMDLEFANRGMALRK
jgi:hypothetical protein